MAKPKAKRKLSEPVKHSQEVADRICDLLADGWTLKQACREAGMPTETAVRKWALKDEQFGSRYTRAREIGYLRMADEILEIADDARNDWVEREGRDGKPFVALNDEAIARARLRIDTRKWLLAKALPKVYGDRQQVDVSVRHVAHMDDDELFAIAAGGRAGVVAQANGSAKPH